MSLYEHTSTNVSKPELQQLVGSFVWFFGTHWLIETSAGSFIWREGDNLLYPYKGSRVDFEDDVGHRGFFKGNHRIGERVGHDLTLSQANSGESPKDLISLINEFAQYYYNAKHRAEEWLGTSV